MIRLATCTVVLICASALACNEPQSPLFPPECVPIPGAKVEMTVNRDALIPDRPECIVLDRDAKVRWAGDDNVKRLALEWKTNSDCRAATKEDREKLICSPAPSKECNLDTTGMKGSDVPFCYSVGVLDINDDLKIHDPRLIIRR